MKDKLSQRASTLKPSATLAMSAKAKELKSQGVDVVDFGAGEPDFPTPSHIREAAKRSLDRGETFYTPVGGTLELRKAVAQRFVADYELVYKPDEIVVSCGAKHSLYNIFQALLDPGDEVIILSPYWVSYPEMVTLTGATPVIVSTEEQDGFIPDPSRVEASVRPSTAALLLNCPSNPTGVLYPPQIMAELARIAERHNLLVISDDIYDKLVYDGRPYTPFASLPGMQGRTVLVNGVSKTYAMTGLRIGYLASQNSRLVKAVANIQSQSTSNPSNTAQAAATEALNGPQDEVAQMHDVFEKRRNLMAEGIGQIPRLSLVKPAGAFYAFVNTGAYSGKNGIADSGDFAAYLLERHHVSCVPGGAFGSDQHVRLSFATDEQTIAKGLERIAAACRELA
ncbi:MAG: pyridoxal phosphate-dependent aminotransferase [Thermodesulfobacteriota bacterium]